MAFASMFLVMIFVIITVVGLVILLTGMILDIIWGVRKKKQKKVNVVHKIFAVFLTVLGLIAGIGPLALLGIGIASSKISDYSEIAKFDKSDRVYIDDCQDIYDSGFDFRGEHYIKGEDIHPQPSHENYKKEEVGIIVDSHDNQRIIYSVDNLMGITILDVEYSSGVFVKADDVDKIMDYYGNEAPLYCEYYEAAGGSGKKVTENVDSALVREIRDRIINEGSAYNSGDPLFQTRESDFYFYSKDDMCCIDISCINGRDGLIACYLGRYIVLNDEEADFLKSLEG